MEFAMAAASALTSTVSTATTSIGSALGVGGTAAAGAPLNLLAGTAAAPASTGSSFLGSVLQGASGIFSAMGAIRSGEAQAEAYRASADDTRLQIGQEDINNTLKQTSMRRALIQTIGERDVAYAASGVDLSFGTPAEARREAIADASTAMSIEDQSTGMRKAQLGAKASNLEAMAADAEQAGWLKAFGSLASTGFDMIKRG